MFGDTICTRGFKSIFSGEHVTLLDQQINHNFITNANFCKILISSLAISKIFIFDES